MEHIDTYLLMRELQTRLNDGLYDPEPRADSMLNTLLTHGETKEDSTRMLKWIDREMRIMINRYNLLMHERIKDLEEFS